MLKRSITWTIDLHGLLLVVLAGGWIVGILLSSWLLLPPLVLPGGAALFLVATGVYWRKPPVRYVALTLLCLCLGAWRYTTVAAVNDTHAVNTFIGQKGLELQGNVAEEPELEKNSTLLLVNVQSVSLDEGQNWQDADGEIEVQMLGSTFDDPYGPHYGDSIQLTGTLNAPPSYATPQLLASMAFPGIYIQSQGGNPLLVWLYGLRTTLAGILMQALPQPFAALLIAIFLSLRTPALKPLLALFNVTGVAHLIAPSGFKVTLLAGLISEGTSWLSPDPRTHKGQSWLPVQKRRGNWRHWLRTGLLALVIAGYTFLSGGGPAALRAGIMGILLVLAPRLGRAYNVYTALALTAWFMSLVSPFTLWDTGFQLSFTGTAGIVLFTPYFQHLLRYFARLPLSAHIAEILAVTLAAQIATLPVLALSFNQISFVAPLANMLTVPLLSVLLGLGTLVCLGGLISLHLAIIAGWLVWPLLWYTNSVISWCAWLPGAYLLIDNLNPALAWIYYALLACLAILLFSRQLPEIFHADQHVAPLFSRRTRYLLQGSVALLMILGTGTTALAAQPDGHLTITLLSSGDPTQGQALLLHTPTGQVALIDEGANSVTLTQTLDAQLPFWQRSLDLIVLTDTGSSNLSGLQDVLDRYQVAQIVDGGMLHPSAAYARWRETLDERDLPYIQVRQGASIRLGNQVTFQVLWPPAELHKSSSEEHDNALILRLLAPGLQMLLFNSAVLSSFALKTLPTEVTAAYLQGAIIQMSGEQGLAFPPELINLLTPGHPSLLLVTSLPTHNKKSSARTGTGVNSTGPPAGPWQIVQTGQISELSIQSNTHGWNLNL
jgi:competence protein ComEC